MNILQYVEEMGCQHSSQHEALPDVLMPNAYALYKGLMAVI